MRPSIGIWQRLRRDEKGLEAVEYAIIAGLIVATAIITLSILGMWVTGQFDAVSDNLDTGQ